MGKYNDSDQILADEMFLQEGVGNVPIWKRYALTIAEAAVYYHIGEKKLRAIVDEQPNADFLS